MLAENAVLCQRNYDGFLCYFFYLIITISFVGWGEPKLSQKLESFKNTV